MKEETRKMPGMLRMTLSKALSSKLKLKSVDLLEKLFPQEQSKPMKIGFYIPSSGEPMHIVTAGQFDFKVNGIIRDNRYGSIGLIQYVSGIPSKEQIEDLVEGAAYFRHLIVQHTPPQKLPFCVELVFLLEGVSEDRSAGDDMLANVGDVLRGAVQKSSYMHTLGVNVIREGELNDIDALRRGFPWLLSATEDWLRDKISILKNKQEHWDLQKLELTDYRVAGNREWEPTNSKLHVIHGLNGSGKSSICEALELMMTGRVERLDSVKDYRSVLTNIDAQKLSVKGKPKSAGITAIFKSGNQLSGYVSQDGFEEEQSSELKKGLRAPEINAGSFRMDQKMSDDLSRGSAPERARIFLDAFFPDKKEKIEGYLEAKRAYENARTGLHPVLKKRLLNKNRDIFHNLISSDLSHFENPRNFIEFLTEGELAWNLMCHLKDEKLPDQGKLTARSPHFRIVDDAWQQMAETAAEWLDIFRTVKDVSSVFMDMPSHRESSLPIATGSFEDSLQNWLRLHATVDLLKRQHAISNTVESVKNDKLKISVPDEINLEHPIHGETRQEKIDELSEELLLAKQQVKSDASNFGEGGSGKRTIDLTNSKLKVLKSFAAFAGRMHQSIPHDLDRLAEVTVKGGGEFPPGQWEQVHHVAVEMSKTMEGILDIVTRGGSRLTDLVKQYQQLAEVSRVYNEEGEASVEEYSKIIANGGKLNCAVNELMSLMTPARWAYQDLSSDGQVSEGERTLEYKTKDGTPASLRLNTAELNTFTIALFLLCSVTQRNPLKMVFLDDPFQNMDEMTVITVSRGLQRLLRAWGRLGAKDWKIVIMLHGQGNVERIQSETSCAVYYLPWLSPSMQSSERENDQFANIETELEIHVDEIPEIREVEKMPAEGE